MCIYIFLFLKVLKNNKNKKKFIESYLSQYIDSPKKNIYIPSQNYLQFLSMLLILLTIVSIISLYLCFLLILRGHPLGFLYLLAVLFLPFFSVIFPFLYFTDRL